MDVNTTDIIIIISIAYGAASELIGLSPKLQSSSVIQVVMAGIGKFLTIFNRGKK